MKIEINDNLYALCEDYANLVFSARQHRNSTRRDNDPTARIRNEMMGKMGEFAAWMAGFGTKMPDVRIYVDGDRNYRFGADVGGSFHIKTCSKWIYDRGGKPKYSVAPSWLVEWKDPVILNPQKEDLIALLQGDLEADKPVFEYYGYVKATDLPPYLKEPVRKDLAKNKVAFYVADMGDIVIKDETCQRTVTDAQIAELAKQLFASVGKQIKR